MTLKIKNLKDRRVIKNNIIKNENNLPLSIKGNANNFLSKFKGK